MIANVTLSWWFKPVMAVVLLGQFIAKREPRIPGWMVAHGIHVTLSRA